MSLMFLQTIISNISTKALHFDVCNLKLNVLFIKTSQASVVIWLRKFCKGNLYSNNLINSNKLKHLMTTKFM